MLWTLARTEAPDYTYPDELVLSAPQRVMAGKAFTVRAWTYDEKGKRKPAAGVAVSGALAGREGTFVLQHSGTMSSAGQSLVVTVVPDSGTGDLVGLAGAMEILIEDGQHFYRFEYTLGDPAS